MTASQAKALLVFLKANLGVSVLGAAGFWLYAIDAPGLLTLLAVVAALVLLLVAATISVDPTKDEQRQIDHDLAQLNATQAERRRDT